MGNPDALSYVKGDHGTKKGNIKMLLFYGIIIDKFKTSLVEFHSFLLE